MRFFDIQAKKLKPDIFITGLESPPELIFAESGSADTARQIVKNGEQSYELNNINLGSGLQDFSLSMICMPLSDNETVIQTSIFNLKLIDAHRYLITTPDGKEEIINFDSSCHYLNVSRKGSQISVVVNKRLIEITAMSDPIDNFLMFTGTGSVLVDKLFLSTNGSSPASEHYLSLIGPSAPLNFGDQTVEWVNNYEIQKPIIYTKKEAEFIDGKYIVSIADMPPGGTTLRNMSKSPLKITYNSGKDWLPFKVFEKVPRSIESIIVASETADFEIVVDTFAVTEIRLPGALFKISGDAYPYHRDDQTYYTNNSNDFSNASITLDATDNLSFESVWLYGKVSQSLIDEIAPNFIYKDGKRVTAVNSVDEANHLYLLGVSSTDIIINSGKDNFFCLNAVGLSRLTDTDSGLISRAYNLFANNTAISFAEEVPTLEDGNLNGKAYSIIDVQWTI